MRIEHCCRVVNGYQIRSLHMCMSSATSRYGLTHEEPHSTLCINITECNSSDIAIGPFRAGCEFKARTPPVSSAEAEIVIDRRAARIRVAHDLSVVLRLLAGGDGLLRHGLCRSRHLRSGRLHLRGSGVNRSRHTCCGRACRFGYRWSGSTTTGLVVALLLGIP